MITFLFSLIVSFTFQFLVYFGLGYVVALLVRKESNDFFQQLLFGLFGLTFILLISHFFMAISAKLAIPVGLIACVGIFLKFKKDPLKKPEHLTALLLMTVCCLVFVSYLKQPWLIAFDTSLYHHQKVLMYTEESVWPGLALLHTRLGFNISFFLPVAFFYSVPFLADTLHYTVSSFWVLSFLIYLMYIISKRDVIDQVMILFIYGAIAIVSVVIPGIWGYSPDLVIAVIVTYMLLQVFLSLRQSQTTDFFSSIFLIALAISIKLSSVIMLVPVVAVFTVSAIRSSFQRTLILTTVVILPFMILWTFHGYLESGYVSYPAPFTIADADWSIPESVRLLEVEYTRNWARATIRYQEITNSFDWFFLWLDVSRPNRWLSVLLPVSFIIGVFAIRKQYKQMQRLILFYWLVWISIGLWFWIAPDVRFGLAVIIFVFAMTVFWVIQKNNFYSLLSRIHVGPGLISFLSICGLTLYMIYGIYLQSAKYQYYPITTVPLSLVTGKYMSGWQPVQGIQCGVSSTPCSPGFPVSLYKTNYQIGPFQLQGYNIENKDTEVKINE